MQPGETKNADFQLGAVPELDELLREQRARTSELERELSRVIPFVFHRRGKPIHDFRSRLAKGLAGGASPTT